MSHKITPKLIAHIREKLSYDPQTGVLTWKALPPGTQRTNSWNAAFAGKRAGSFIYRSGKPAKREVTVQYTNIPEQYAAFVLSGITIPPGTLIDHINGDPFDNRLCNLRLATNQQNSSNALHKPGKHGVRGVTHEPHRKRWRAIIYHNNKKISLGRHRTKGLAALAYAKAALRLSGAFSHIYRAHHNSKNDVLTEGTPTA